MFSGIIESKGKISHVAHRNDGIRLAIETPLAKDLSPGESVNVDGVCLTVTSKNHVLFLLTW